MTQPVTDYPIECYRCLRGIRRYAARWHAFSQSAGAPYRVLVCADRAGCIAALAAYRAGR
jgi:hypothetical protein